MENSLNWITAWVLIGNLISVIVLVRINSVHKKAEAALAEIREVKSFLQGAK
jgi:hypothetical protein